MNYKAVFFLLGCVCLIVAAFLLVPAGIGLLYGEHDAAVDFLLSALFGALAGLAMTLPTRGSRVGPDGRPDYFRREGLAVVGLSWLVAGVIGAVPYLMTRATDSPVDAIFETVSGFTTTGSTILSGEEIVGMSKALAFWRSFTHWLGGFGIVMVFVVLFPTGGRSLFRSEIPGISREAGRQRVRDSAMTLMKIYVGLSAAEFVLLWLAGMTWFDSALHTFGTIATGGFSNYAESVAYFASWKIELVIGFFMFVCGVNFAAYDLALRSGWRTAASSLLKSLEFRTYAGMVLGSGFLIGCILWFWGGSNGVEGAAVGDYRSFWRSVRDATFQTICLQTSTGYATADFDLWPQVCRVWLMMLAIVGACAGSTGGGIKVIRFLIVAKAALAGVRRFIRPRAIHAVRIDGQTLDESVVASVTGYFGLWTLVFLGGTMALTMFGVDSESAATAVIACLNNIGPGLGMVGPTMNFAEMPDVVKVLLTLFMILGRLEFYAVVALFVPGFWRN